MDTFARGLIIADKLIRDKVENFIKERYISYESGVGKKIINNEVGFEELESYVFSLKEIKNTSGRQ